MNRHTSDVNAVTRAWVTTEPGRPLGRGRPAGDFLEAWGWDVLEEAGRYVKGSAHVPDQVGNCAVSGNLQPHTFRIRGIEDGPRQMLPSIGGNGRRFCRLWREKMQALQDRGKNQLNHNVIDSRRSARW